MAALTDRLFVPAAFVGLLATMPAASAPAVARESWLTVTYARLHDAIPTGHGLEALRLASVVRRELGR